MNCDIIIEKCLDTFENAKRVKPKEKCNFLHLLEKIVGEKSAIFIEAIKVNEAKI